MAASWLLVVYSRYSIYMKGWLTTWKLVTMCELGRLAEYFHAIYYDIINFYSGRLAMAMGYCCTSMKVVLRYWLLMLVYRGWQGSLVRCL